MRRAIRWGVPVLLVLLIVAYGLISYIIASGVTKAERKDQEDHPSAYGLEYEDVEFISRKGDVTLEGWYIPGQSRRPTILFVHGIGSFRSGDNAVELSSRLVDLGFNVLLFDLRAHGSSGGEKISGGYFEREDVLGAFDFLVEQGAPPGSIGLIGFSMGAGISVLSAAKEPAIHALVADSPFANASDLIAQETARKTPFPEWITPVFVPGAKLAANLFYGINVGALVPEEVVKRLPYPVLVIHGLADTRIPSEHGVRVYQAAHPDSSIWLIPEVEHVDAFLDYPDEYFERIVDYFDSRLIDQ